DSADEVCGIWTREQFVQMNDRFVASVQAAFDQGLENPAAARATIRVKSSLKGSRRLAEDAAIGGVWNWFVGVKFEATAVEVMARVRGELLRGGSLQSPRGALAAADAPSCLNARRR